MAIAQMEMTAIARFSLSILALAVVVMGITFVLRPATNSLSFKIVLIGMLVASCLWYVMTLWFIRGQHATLAATALLLASVLSSYFHGPVLLGHAGTEAITLPPQPPFTAM